MKKIISLALAALMLLALFTGCGKTEDPSSTPPTDTPSSDTPEAPAIEVLDLTEILAAAKDDSLKKVLDAGKITVGTSPDFAPSEFIDLSKTGQDQYVGSDMELARFLAAKLGVELEIKAMDFDTVTASVSQGTIDLGISGFTLTAKRAENYTVSEPYNKGNYQGIMIRKADADKYKSLEDFKGVVIGAQNASLQYDLIVEQLPECEIKLVGKLAEGIMMLQGGQIDALGMSGTSGDGYARNYPDLIMCDIHYDWVSPGVVALMTQGNESLKAAVDEVIKIVNEEKLYEQWQADAQDLAFAIGANT